MSHIIHTVRLSIPFVAGALGLAAWIAQYLTP